MRKTATALSEPARTALGLSVITDDGLGLKLPGTPGTASALPRTVYMECAEALERAGFRWNRRAGAHVLISAGKAAEALRTLGVMLDTGVAPAKNPDCWYPTPRHLAQRVARMACAAVIIPAGGRPTNWRGGPTTPIRVLEPSVGEGVLLLGLIDELHQHAEWSERDWIDVTAVEIDRDRAEAADQALDGRFHSLTIEVGDFLDRLPVGQVEPFDLVLMNPPFDKGAAVKHLEHAWALLKPGGRLVAILPGSTEPGFVGTLDVQRALWECLPDNSFAESGTNVSTGILVLDK